MLSDARGRFERLPNNLRGAVWILVASLGFSFMAVCIKVLGDTMDVWQVIAWRSWIALLILSPGLWRARRTVLRTTSPGTHLLRSLLGMGGLTCFFLALIHLDMALATTLGFTRILFVIVLAVLLLGEVIRWRRTAATLVGFVGVLVCVQPGDGAFDPWTLAALLAALFSAGVTVFIKRLTRTESPLTIMAWSYIIMGVVTTLPTLVLWRTPTLTELALVAASAVASAWGQSCMVLGLRAGEATVVAPFEYTRLLYAGALGFFLFQEVPASSTWLGGAIIIGSTAYIGVREARLAAERRGREAQNRV